METVAAPARAQVYRPRHPERTVLYGVLAHHFERFLLSYEERFQPAHGYLRRSVEPAVHRYLDCGIFDHGVARVRCPDCRHEFLVAFSCKLRGRARAPQGSCRPLGSCSFHPHVHVLVTAGGFAPDGSFRRWPGTTPSTSSGSSAPRCCECLSPRG